MAGSGLAIEETIYQRNTATFGSDSGVIPREDYIYFDDLHLFDAGTVWDPYAKGVPDSQLSPGYILSLGMET